MVNSPIGSYVKCGLDFIRKLYDNKLMINAKTKYFGIIGANEDDSEIIIVTKINVTGKEQEISVQIKAENISQELDNCIEILDDYKILFENGKRLLKAEYYKNNEMEKFFDTLIENYGEEKIFEIFGIETINENNINALIKKLNGPDISLEVKNEKVNIFLVYGLSNEIEEMIVIKMDRKYEMEDIRYYV